MLTSSCSASRSSRCGKCRGNRLADRALSRFGAAARSAGFLCLGLLLVALPGLAGAAPQQVRAARPRVLVDAATVQTLPARCRHERLAPFYDELRKFAYSGSANQNLWVAPDQLTGVLVVYLAENRDPRLRQRIDRFLDQCMQAPGDSWTRPRMLKALALAYDWLHDELGTARRVQMGRRMRQLAEQMQQQYRHADYNNHVYLEYGPLLYAALALHGEPGFADWADGLLDQCEERLKAHFVPAVNQLGGGEPGERGDGGWHESMSYWSFFAYEFAHQLEAWRTATGEDLFTACPGLGGAANWFLYGTRPHDHSLAPIADIETPVRWGRQELALMPLLAARYEDPAAQYVWQQTPVRYPWHAWPLVLWAPLELPPISVRSLPTGTLYDGLGWAALRSDWSEQAVWALFVCGDYFAGHQHSDQNSIVISCQGPLLIDAGQYGAKATEFHNSVLIGGGQRLFGNDPRQHVTPTQPGGPFDTGEILAFEQNPEFTYVVGDASNAYRPDRGQQQGGAGPRFVRRLLMLQPNLFIVDDEIAPAGEKPVTWLWHTQAEPTVGERAEPYAFLVDNGRAALRCLPIHSDTVSEIEQSSGTAGRSDRPYHRVAVRVTEPADSVRMIHLLQVVTARQATGSAARKEQAGSGSKIASDTNHIEIKKTGPWCWQIDDLSHGQRWTLELPPIAQDAGSLSLQTLDGTAIIARRPLPAGILPYGRDGVALLERWDRAYRDNNRAPWDSGRPSSDLRAAVESGQLEPCRVLELGCGSGTNAVYLAQRGFDVTALDIAPTALAKAARRAEEAGVDVRWILADVLRPPPLRPFDLIYDRGCYHGVRRVDAEGYVETVRRLTRPGGQVLILAGNANAQRRSGPPQVTEQQIRADFAERFQIERLQETRFDSARPDRPGALAWSILLRRAGQAAEE